MITIQVIEPYLVKDPLSSNTASLRQAVAWLQYCNENHSVCRNVESGNRWLPTRLIRVDRENRVRLEYTDQLPPHTRYATLSHCWGRLPGFQLVKSNETELQSDIPWALLPRVFQDTFKVALKLGIQYVWIDSLCIMFGSASPP
jgi:hypothetical protein